LAKDYCEVTIKFNYFANPQPQHRFFASLSFLLGTNSRHDRDLPNPAEQNAACGCRGIQEHPSTPSIKLITKKQIYKYNFIFCFCCCCCVIGML